MNPEAFRAALAQLGISPAWLARQCGRSARTGHHWQQGQTPVPPAVGAWLLRRLVERDADPPPRLPVQRGRPSTPRAEVGR